MEGFSSILRFLFRGLENPLRNGWVFYLQLSKYSTIDYVTGAISKSEASVKTYASQNFASASLTATVNNIKSVVAATSYSTILSSQSGSSASHIQVQRNAINLTSTGRVILSGTTTEVRGNISITGGLTVGSRTARWTAIRTAVNNNYYVLANG